MKIINRLVKFIRGAQHLREHDSETPEVTRSESLEVSAPAQTPSYAADQPIRTKDEDRFNRWPFAERMIQKGGEINLVVAMRSPQIGTRARHQATIRNDTLTVERPVSVPHD